MEKKGDSNQITREYFDRILLEMRHIDSVLPNTSVKLFGESFCSPVATAALSHLNDTCEQGMVKMAQGAAMAGALCFSGMGERQELADMCQTGAKVIKIIKPHADNETVYEKIRQAEEDGAFGVGMDIDHAFNGQGEYDVVCGLPMKSKSLEELRNYVHAANLPFVVKGVLSTADAVKAMEIGASAIVVSHHHGIMDYAVPPLMILPQIAETVAGRIPIFVDCCVESGMDVFKALALGANAVCVGRAIMGPLQENGAEGVRDTLMRMNGELKGVMARTGFGTVDAIDSSVIRYRGTSM